MSTVPNCSAAIGRLPDTLMDRSIVIHMKRRLKAQRVERFRMTTATTAAKPIRDAAACFARARQDDIASAYQCVLDEDLDFLNDRDADLWTPLFGMCGVLDPSRLKELKQCATILSAAKTGDDMDESYALTLLRDIRAVWPDGEDKYEDGTAAGKTPRLSKNRPGWSTC